MCVFKTEEHTPYRSCFRLEFLVGYSGMAKPKFINDRDELEKLAPLTQAPIKRHVFVCNGKSCSAVGSAEVKAAFEKILESKGLRQGKESKGRNPMGEIVLTDCSSVGFCSIGTAVSSIPKASGTHKFKPKT